MPRFVPKQRRKYVGLTPSTFIAALKGTRGILCRIAENVGCTRATIDNFIHGRTNRGKIWDAAREAYYDECERFGDDAETTIGDAIDQRLDIATAARTALVVMKSKFHRRGWIDKTTVAHEGGATPIQVNHRHTLVDVDKLDLPLEVRKQILEAMEKNDGQADRGEGGAAGDDE